MSGIKTYSGEFLYNSTFGLAKRVYNVGLSEALYKVSGSLPDGKVVKWLIASFKLGSHYSSEFHTTFKLFITTIAEPAKDYFYATQWIGGMADLLSLNVKQLKEETGATISKVLLSLGSFSEAGRFAKKYGIYDFPVCSRISKALGTFEVYGVKPFAVKPLSLFCNNPKDFFIYLSSFVNIFTSAYTFVFAKGSAAEKEKIRKGELSVEKILTRVGDVGKIILIHCGNTHFKSLWFAWIDFGTQTVSLLGLIIRRKTV